jgi:flagellar biosynthesis GTPase FlhF
VEQIRLGGTKPLSAKKRAEKVQAEVTNAELGVIKIDPKLYGGNAEWNDKQVVIVATYLPTGEFQVNAVVKHDSAVNAALAGYYSQKESKKRAEAKALRDQEAAEKQAAEQQKHEEKKAQEEATQKVEVEAERAEDARQLMQEAHFNSILEAVPA